MDSIDISWSPSYVLQQHKEYLISNKGLYSWTDVNRWRSNVQIARFCSLNDEDLA